MLPVFLNWVPSFSRVSISENEPKQITQTMSIFSLSVSKKSWNVSQIANLHWQPVGSSRLSAGTKFICLEMLTKKGEEIKQQCFSRKDKTSQEYINLQRQVEAFPGNVESEKMDVVYAES